jgi:sugar phosphate isomerase/epimerase
LAVTAHPMLSVSEMCTYPWPFADELALWEELGVRRVGLLAAKVDAHGREAVVAALAERSMVATTVIAPNFDLSAPDTWEGRRAAANATVDLAAQIGGCVYFTPGRRDGRSFDELTASLADAVAPCVEHAKAFGIRLAIEPSLRTDVSYVHTLRDGLDVAARAGIDVIADLGNCWMERDYEATVRRGGDRIAAVQFADAVFGTPQEPPPGGRAVPGDGDLPVGAC